MRKIVLFLVIPAVLIGGALWLFSGNLPPDRGQVGYIDGAFVALDQQSFALLTQAVEWDDLELFASLRSSRRVLHVSGRVRVRALTAMDANLMQIELLEGEYAGRAVWIQGAQVKRR